MHVHKMHSLINISANYTKSVLIVWAFYHISWFL